MVGGFSTADDGVFSVTLSPMPPEGCDSSIAGNLAFGPYVVDAKGARDGVTPVSLKLCVAYTDTQRMRGPFVVQLRIPSFELPIDQRPTFDGADSAHFQIPNRYLVLTNVDAITGGSTSPGTGALAESSEAVGETFANDGPLPIAHADAGSGVISAKQEIEMTLNIPAGVFPGTYTTTITVETVTAP